jgi:hypothetical protein
MNQKVMSVPVSVQSQSSPALWFRWFHFFEFAGVTQAGLGVTGNGKETAWRPLTEAWWRLGIVEDEN